MRDVLLKALVSLGAEVVLLPGDCHPEAVIRAAVAEDAVAAIVSTYNGAALRQATQLIEAAGRLSYDGAVFMGGVLNEDTGGEVPCDVTDRIRALGIRCVDDVRSLPGLLRGLRRQPALS